METRDTVNEAAVETGYAGLRPSDDPQAVQVEPSGISAADSRRRKRWRNLAIAVSLGAFVVLIFVITLVKLGANVLDRPL